MKKIITNKKNNNKNISNQTILEPIYNTIQYIHIYDDFYSTTPERKGFIFEDIVHKVSVVKSHNGNYLILVKDIKDSYSKSAHNSWEEIFSELLNIYPDLNSQNTFLVEIGLDNNRVEIDEHLNCSWKSLSFLENIDFLNVSLYDLMFIYSHFDSDNNTIQKVRFLFETFRNEQIIEYVNLNYEINNNIFIYLKEAILEEFKAEDLAYFFVNYINKNNIDFIETEENINFMNGYFLDNLIFSEDMIRDKNFFIDNYIKYINHESIIKYKKEFLSPYLLRAKISSF